MVDAVTPVALSLLMIVVAPEPEPGPEPEPVAEPAPSDLPPAGGFGSVTSVTTESDVVAPAPTQPVAEGEGEDEGPRYELSARAELGYGQVELGNREGLDHQGAFLRIHAAVYPWLSKRRRVGVGFGLVYGYQGLNRRELPPDAGLERSEAQQQQILFSVPLLVRPQREWFSIQPSAMIGAAFYTGGEVWAADRRARLPRSELAFVAGGDLALCTAWDIVCVVGGGEYLVGAVSVAVETGARRILDPWGWHVALGVDVLRIMDRANRT